VRVILAEATGVRPADRVLEPTDGELADDQ